MRFFATDGDVRISCINSRAITRAVCEPMNFSFVDRESSNNATPLTPQRGANLLSADALGDTIVPFHRSSRLGRRCQPLLPLAQ
jgi:hypothetical protein